MRPTIALRFAPSPYASAPAACTFSMSRLAIQQQPDITFPYITVSVSYAGTPPTQMETEVTRKVEDAVSNLVFYRPGPGTVVGYRF